jgi:pyruvate/2-oxoglutarate dehydrogenase complex dihydrolipoamide dehydrogenase (E3) component
MSGFIPRIDVCRSDESVEDRGLHLLEKLKSGEIKVEDLMGPLSGAQGLTTEMFIPPGGKTPTPSAPEATFSPVECEHNRELMSHVHPADYVNPEPPQEPFDLVVIGAGVSGLLSVIVGAWLGKRCALIERHAMGGDCLNTGCVPSKALIACAREFHKVNNVEELKEFGISLNNESPSKNLPYKVDFGLVMKRMRAIRAKISHHDSVQRYSSEFCESVYVGHAEFVQTSGKYSAAEMKVGGFNGEVCVTADDGSKQFLRFKKAMVATGASASIPPVPGLKKTPHLTNSSFFNLTELPETIIVVGCGPIGLELSQSLRRFGCNVVCLERGPQLLMREDADAAELVRQSLKADGVIVHTNVDTELISLEGGDSDKPRLCAPWGKYTARVRDMATGKTTVYEAQALLNCTGRTPNVMDCGLDNVGVEWDNRQGVKIDDYFATTNPHIYSCGDCASPYKFTHAADFQARYAIRNMFLGKTERQSDLLIPWCTYTEPEVAHVGKYEAELDKKGIKYEVLMRQLKDVDRCLCDGLKSGFVKILMAEGGANILGATICGPNAGDMISEITVAIQWGVTVPQLAGTIHPYPTTAEAIRQACLFGYMKYYKNPEGAPLAAVKLLMKEQEKKEEGGEQQP